jgi:hypothetical protein
MPVTEGIVTFDFGTGAGTNTATTTVPDTNAATASRIEIFLMGTDSTGDHNAYEHAIIPLGGWSASPISISNGVSFTAQAATQLRLTGDVKCRYVIST